MSIIKKFDTRDFRIGSDEELTAENLADFIAAHRQRVQTKYQVLSDAYETKYAIFGMPPKEDWKPDNRIAVNFAMYLVDRMTGYFVGIPVKYSSDDKTVDDYVNLINDYNDIDDLNSELSKQCDIYGKAYELYFVDDNKQISIAVLSPKESFMIFDDSILRRPRAFVRVYTDADDVRRGSVSTEKYVRYFDIDPSFKWTSDEILHGFDGVPATEYVQNTEQIGIFEPVLSMINAYNKAVSEKANDVDYFADTYMKILGAKVEADDVMNIRNDRIVNFEGEYSGNIVAEFMDKPSGDETQEHLIDRLERMIFNISGVANISDDNFAGDSSGIALKYKLQAMSDKAETKKNKFKAAMNRRYKLIFSSAAHPMPADAWAGIRYKFTPNVPANIQEEAEIAAKLAGVTSQETQLSVLSIVDSVGAEQERIKEEQQELFDDTVGLRQLLNIEGADNGTDQEET